jgi:lysyl-tRNA synthetase class 1
MTSSKRLRCATAKTPWFQALYETLLGSSHGPRLGSFIALYGIDNCRRLISEALRSA